MNSPFSYIGSILWKKRPIQLTFFVTRKCNGRCPFCFYLRKSRETVQGRAELSLQEIQQIAQSMGNLLWVLFSGGEPFLREDIVEISKIFYQNNKPAILTYPTNGLSPELVKEKTEEILNACQKSLIVIKLSMDGLAKDHDDLRQVPGGFERLFDTYEALSRLVARYANLEIGINTVFCSQNQYRIDGSKGVIEFVRGLHKIHTHTISMVRGELREQRYKKINLRQYYRVIQVLKKNLFIDQVNAYRFKGGLLKAAQDNLQHELIYRTMLRRRRLIPCYAGKLNLVLSETGDLFPCELSQQAIGNVRAHNYDVGKMIRTTGAKQMIRAITSANCYCSHECYFTTNILFNPRLFPRLTGEYLKLKFPKVAQKGNPFVLH